MRTTVDLENDVLAVAKALAKARRVSVGAALSQLARRGIAAQTPLTLQHGFPVFQVPEGTPGFSEKDVSDAEESESIEAASAFLEPGL